jgi:hypothetical protein
MNAGKTKPSPTKRVTTRRWAQKSECTTDEAWLNMATRTIVAKNDLHYVRQPGMTGSFSWQEKNRAGVNEFC